MRCMDKKLSKREEMEKRERMQASTSGASGDLRTVHDTYRLVSETLKPASALFAAFAFPFFNSC